jgi:adenosylmethionine-8-amino-7-oxononanoate transaminase
MDEKEARRIEEADRTSVWHPFTPMFDYEKQTPLVIERAEGVYLYDVRGRRYIDGVSSLWVNIHGHRRKEIDRAIIEQLDRIAHSTLLGLANVPSALLAQRLLDIAPGRPARVFYSDNGSTANEVAIKMAFQYFKRRGESRDLFFRFTNAYHGDTMGSVSVGGIDVFHRTFGQLTFPTRVVTAPHCYRCPFGRDRRDCGEVCFDEATSAFAAHGARCAAAIIEPVVQGAAGIHIQPKGYLAHVAALCREHGVLLAVDEVATGFGRTGVMFACEHEGVTPDLLSLAKGVTGGYLPLAATLVAQEVYEGFLDADPASGTFFHGHTYTGNPLACAAALACLDIFETDRTLEKLGPKIGLLESELAILARRPHVGDVRQKGFMVGIELVADRETRTPYPPKKRVGAAVTTAARKRGVVVRSLGDVVVIMPPLSIEAGELAELLSAVSGAIEEVTEPTSSPTPRR